MRALGEAGGKSRKCSMGKVGTSVDSSTGGKVVGTSSGNGGLVGGDDRSVRVGNQVHVAQMVERSLSM